MRHLLAFLAVILCVSCVSGTKKDVLCDDYYTDLCKTNETNYTIESYFLGKERQILRTFKDQPDDSYIFGAYTSPNTLTGGECLYFFPDNSFAVDEISDIGPPRAIAIGKWVMQSDRIVVTDIYPEMAAKWIEQDLGKDCRLKIFIVRNGDMIGDTILVPEQNLAKEKFQSMNYLRRWTYYIDWMKLKHERFEKESIVNPHWFKMPNKPVPPMEQY